MKYNFNKIATLNQGTSYDYSSVMQYHRYGRACGPAQEAAHRTAEVPLLF